MVTPLAKLKEEDLDIDNQLIDELVEIFSKKTLDRKTKEAIKHKIDEMINEFGDNGTDESSDGGENTDEGDNIVKSWNKSKSM